MVLSIFIDRIISVASTLHLWENGPKFTVIQERNYITVHSSLFLTKFSFNTLFNFWKTSFTIPKCLQICVTLLTVCFYTTQIVKLLYLLVFDIPNTFSYFCAISFADNYVFFLFTVNSPSFLFSFTTLSRSFCFLSECAISFWVVFFFRTSGWIRVVRPQLMSIYNEWSSQEQSVRKGPAVREEEGTSSKRPAVA